MRGKLASGIMRQLDLPELVATSDEAFVDMAVQLTADTARRQRLSAEIATRRHILFNDLEPIRAFERHLLDLVG
jgi:predicted O-linked N-acetylglucosamine transferase (SPINDLY family)